LNEQTVPPPGTNHHADVPAGFTLANVMMLRSGTVHTGASKRVGRTRVYDDPRPHACRRGLVVVVFVAAPVVVRVTKPGFHAGRQPASTKQAELWAESDQE
jgi:hypothetical protein